MADIAIKDSSGNLLSTLDSKDGTTVGDLLDMIGAGVLQKDGVLKANKNYILVPGTYTLGPPVLPPATLLGRQEIIQNFADGVFVLYRGEENDPIGTAFAISPVLMLTACHNVVHRSEDKKVVTEVNDLKVASSIDKAAETMEFSAVGQVREVEVYKYNIDVDWACLKLKDGSASFDFAIPLAAHDKDIPKAATLEKMYIYHCPVQLFLDDAEMVRCHVMVKEASVGIVAAKTINFQNGGFPGSCGGPYMFRNKAIALHVDSISTTKEAKDLKDEMTETRTGKRRKLTSAEITRKMVDSCVSSHSSLGTGIILHVRSGISSLLSDGRETSQN